MSFFSNIFKSKPKKTFETKDLGVFTLVYSKKNKNLWSNNNSDCLLTTRGSQDEPDKEHLNFFKSVNTVVDNLSPKITQRFLEEFKEADLDADFVDWKTRFKMVAMEIMVLFEGEAYWNITFEDLKKPFAHFTLYIEGQKLTDFSIDT